MLNVECWYIQGKHTADVTDLKSNEHRSSLKTSWNGKGVDSHGIKTSLESSGIKLTTFSLKGGGKF